MSLFSELGLKPELCSAVERMGYETPTPIQNQVIPQLISSDEDVIALAQTGTGKTAGFGLPLLHKIDTEDKTVQGLILCPTRELCLQIAGDLEQFGRDMPKVGSVPVYGGANIMEQIKALRKNPQIIIGTPGRTLDLLQRGALRIDNLRMLVLDEADEMVNRGFREDLDAILSHAPSERQSLLFSATMPKEVERIAQRYMKDAVRLEAERREEHNETITHVCFTVKRGRRMDALMRLIDADPEMYGVVFCRTRRETADLAEKLIARGYSADALHGDMSQALRDRVMDRFRKRKLQLLIATDVAARGLDVDDLSHVIHYQLPDDPEVYIHRSGRTGRAGKTGHSFALLESREHRKLDDIKRELKRPIEEGKIPEATTIIREQLQYKLTKLSGQKMDYEQLGPFLSEIHDLFQPFSKSEIVEWWAMAEMKKFLDAHSSDKDPQDSGRGDGSGKKRSRDRDGGHQEAGFETYVMSAGRNQGMSPALIMGIINEQTRGAQLGIGKIQIKNHISLVDIEEGALDQIRKSFRNAEFDGMQIEIRLDERQGSGGGRGGRGPRSGGSRAPRSGGYSGGSRGAKPFRAGGGRSSGGSKSGRTSGGPRGAKRSSSKRK